MNAAQKALLHRLREDIDKVPKSGALNKAKQPLYPQRFAQAVEARSEDGEGLVEFCRRKVHEPPTDGYTALIEAGHPELTVEAAVADPDAEWASEFTDADRAAAINRLGAMEEAHRKSQEEVEAAAVTHDRKIVADVSQRRVAKGQPPLTPEQEEEMLARLAAERAPDG